MQVEPLRAEYRDRDARVAVAEEQGLDAVLLFPTLGCGVEEALRDDVPATMASLSAFNRWLEDDWGFSYQRPPDRACRCSRSPIPTPRSPRWTRCSSAARGSCTSARRRCRRASGGGRSLGDRLHDPVWARLAEAGVPVAFHLGDSGYNALRRARGARAETFEASAQSTCSRGSSSPTARSTTRSASLVVHGVFHRHPKLRVASIENGSDWLHLLVKRLRKLANQTPSAFHEDPLDTVRRHVWVTPYLEDDLRALADLIGVERILFGSDWPHGEGVAAAARLRQGDRGVRRGRSRRIMRENVVELLGSRR